LTLPGVIQQRALTDAPSTVFAVIKQGRHPFLSMIWVTDAAIAELCRLASHSKSSDKWSRSHMKNYLSYTFVRLLEQERVHHVYAEGDALAALNALGQEEHLLVFRTGLFDVTSRPIECICAKNASGTVTQPYTLLLDGVRVVGDVDQATQRLREAVAKPGGFCHPELDQICEASYFAPRDQRLLFDHTADVMPQADQYLHS
jgi:hypothetical protein